MSYTYLLEQGEESSAQCFSDIPASVLSRLKNTQEKSCSNDSEMESSPNSPSGIMSAPLTERHGEDLLMSFVEDFLARKSLLPEAVRELLANTQDSGRKWRESLTKYDQDSCSWKTAQCSLLGGLESFSQTWPRWGTMRDGACWEVPVLVPVPSVPDSFWWPAVTTPSGGGNCGGTGNTKKAKMLGRYIPRQINPCQYEWLMMWPIGWSDLQPLAMDKFLSWQRLHF